jgi:hypothetical protein
MSMAANVRRVVAQKGAPALAWWSASLDHVLGDGRLGDLEAELEQFAVDAWRSPKRVLPVHPLDQSPEVRLDRRPRERDLTAPVATKTGPMPMHERLGTDNREHLQDRWKPSIQLDKEPAIVVRERGPALHLSPQKDQLMSMYRILRFKPDPRLERRD